MFGKTKEVIKEVKVVDETRIKELENELKQQKKDFESEKRILNNEISVRISEAVKEKEAENNKIKEENAVLKEKVNILEKAFENMGFDVKDMKDILNKLVEGIVSKNEIKVIK